jgi:hypothetical protein
MRATVGGPHLSPPCLRLPIPAPAPESTPPACLQRHAGANLAVDRNTRTPELTWLQVKWSHR